MTDMHIINNPHEHRFETSVDGHLAYVEYRLSDGVITLTHTEVAPALEGKGIAGKVAAYALDYARDHQLKVVPSCPYIASYIKRHPEYEPLIG
jgi:hypothetical protein